MPNQDYDDYAGDNNGCAAVLFWVLVILVICIVVLRVGCTFAVVHG